MLPSLRPSQFAHIDYMSGYGSRGGHGRAHKMGAPTIALSALKISVGGGCAMFTGAQFVCIHCQAHGATGLSPIQSSRSKYFI
jgi:hypothetical protein